MVIVTRKRVLYLIKYVVMLGIKYFSILNVDLSLWTNFIDVNSYDVLSGEDGILKLVVSFFCILRLFISLINDSIFYFWKRRRRFKEIDDNARELYLFVPWIKIENNLFYILFSLDFFWFFLDLVLLVNKNDYKLNTVCLVLLSLW